MSNRSVRALGALPDTRISNVPGHYHDLVALVGDVQASLLTDQASGKTTAVNLASGDLVMSLSSDQLDDLADVLS